jgi:hypothetical protein
MSHAKPPRRQVSQIKLELRSNSCILSIFASSRLGVKTPVRESRTNREGNEMRSAIGILVASVLAIVVHNAQGDEREQISLSVSGYEVETDAATVDRFSKMPPSEIWDEIEKKGGRSASFHLTAKGKIKVGSEFELTKETDDGGHVLVSGVFRSAFNDGGGAFGKLTTSIKIPREFGFAQSASTLDVWLQAGQPSFHNITIRHMLDDAGKPIRGTIRLLKIEATK